jgi:hypothetical protein
LPWFFAGLAAFCLFVAGEEISWGQRLLGYRPPAYLLQHNFQQEMNLHNIVDDTLRQAAFLTIVLGYGVVLPASFRVRAVRRLGEGLGIEPPPLELAPSFAATAVLYAVYPWTHSGEWAELMLGSALMLCGATHLHAYATTGRSSPAVAVAPRALSAWAAVLLLGVVTAQAWWVRVGSRPEQLELARIELAALRRDVAASRTRTHCGVHKRLHALASTSGQQHLLAGAFAGLTEQGLPAERAEFLLDPWNSPYWIRHVCSPDWSRRAIYVYSFGPNRRRDSSEWQIVSDDLGAWVSRPRSATDER